MNNNNMNAEGIILANEMNNTNLNEEVATMTMADETSMSDEEFSEIKESADVLVFDQWQYGCICNYGEARWYRFTADATQAYTIRSDSTLNVDGYLYDSSGTQIAYSTNNGNDTDFKIVKSLANGYTYYLKVIADAWMLGEFGLFLTKDTLIDSVTITSDSNIVCIGEEKQFLAIVSPENATNVRLSWFSTSPDVATVDSRTGVVTGISIGEATIDVVAQTRDYIGHFDRYSVIVCPPEGVSKDKAIQVEKFDRLVGGRMTHLNIGSWFCFTANASDAHRNGGLGEYTIYSQGDLDLHAVLYDSDGDSIAFGYDNGVNKNFVITAMLEYGKTYYVYVNSSEALGDYQIKVVYSNARQEGDIYSNAKDTAEELPFDTWKKGCICCVGGERWYQFVTDANEPVHTIIGKGPSDTVGYLYDSSGALLAYDDDKGEDMNFKLSASLVAGETYYVKVKHSYGEVAKFEILVTTGYLPDSVTVEPNPLTVDVTEKRQMVATVSPEGVDDLKVEWHTNSRNVATVDENGVLTANAEGTALVFAVAKGKHGISKIGECELTVEPYVPVRSVMIEPKRLYLKPGETDGFIMKVTPANPTYSSLSYEIDHPEVVSIAPDLNYPELVHVYGLSEGTATITATTPEGNNGSCQVTVDSRDRVQITEDGDYFNVQFIDDPNQLTWKSVGYDLSRTDIWIPDEVKARSNENLLKDFAEEQIAFLYLFDPLGIEYYVKQYYTKRKFDEDVEYLFFKDRIYEKIFGVKPRLFEVLSDDQLLYYNYSENISDDLRSRLFSEAEALFGFHVTINFSKLAKIILEGVFSTLPGVSSILSAAELCQTLFFSGAINGLVSDAASTFLNLYMSSVPGKEVLKLFDWAIDLHGHLKTIGEVLAPPNPNDIIIYNKVNNQLYATYFINGASKLSMEHIINLCEN